MEAASMSSGRKANDVIEYIDKIRNIYFSVHGSGENAYYHLVMEVESRSREGVIHITQVMLGPNGIKTSCSCEAGTFGRECWHRKLAEEIAECIVGRLKGSPENVRQDVCIRLGGYIHAQTAT